MPYHIDWLHPQRIVYGYAYGTYTDDNLSAYSYAILDWIESGTGTVHVITDNNAIAQMKVSLAVAQRLLRTVPTHPRTGWAITVSPNAFHRFMGSIAAQALRVQVRTQQSASVDEALRLIVKNDESLPDFETLFDAYQTLHTRLREASG